MTLLGSAIALANPVLSVTTAFLASSVAAPLTPAVIFWAILLAMSFVGGLIVTLSQEHELLGCFVTGLGFPGLAIALISLPHLT